MLLYRDRADIELAYDGEIARAAIPIPCNLWNHVVGHAAFHEVVDGQQGKHQRDERKRHDNGEGAHGIEEDAVAKRPITRLACHADERTADSGAAMEPRDDHLL